MCYYFTQQKIKKIIPSVGFPTRKVRYEYSMRSGIRLTNLDPHWSKFRWKEEVDTNCAARKLFIQNLSQQFSFALKPTRIVLNNSFMSTHISSAIHSTIYLSCQKNDIKLL